MDINNHIPGDDVMLYIDTDAGYIPVACITSMPFERTTERIETTVRGDGGNKTYIPGLHDYSISVSGVLSKDGAVISYQGLDIMQDNRIIFKWMIRNGDGTISKTGLSFITSLTLNSDSGAWVSFSCSLSPGTTGVNDLILLWTENGVNVVTENGENLTKI